METEAAITGGEEQITKKTPKLNLKQLASETISNVN